MSKHRVKVKIETCVECMYQENCNTWSIYGNNYVITADAFLPDLYGVMNRPHKPSFLALARVVCILNDTSIYLQVWWMI